MRTEEFISLIAQIDRSVQLLARSPFSGEMNKKNSLSSLMAENIRSTCAPNRGSHSAVKPRVNATSYQRIFETPSSRKSGVEI